MCGAESGLVATVWGVRCAEAGCGACRQAWVTVALRTSLSSCACPTPSEALRPVYFAFGMSCHPCAMPAPELNRATNAMPAVDMIGVSCAMRVADIGVAAGREWVPKGTVSHISCYASATWRGVLSQGMVLPGGERYLVVLTLSEVHRALLPLCDVRNCHGYMDLFLCDVRNRYRGLVRMMCDVRN
eukprot:703897-Rhodomonas_salina.4